MCELNVMSGNLSRSISFFWLALSIYGYNCQPRHERSSAFYQLGQFEIYSTLGLMISGSITNMHTHVQA